MIKYLNIEILFGVDNQPRNASQLISLPFRSQIRNLMNLLSSTANRKIDSLILRVPWQEIQFIRFFIFFFGRIGLKYISFGINNR